MSDEKRMIENYEVNYAVQLGGGEVIFAVDAATEMPYLVCDHSWANPLGASEYKDALAGNDSVEMLRIFTDRLSARMDAIEAERNERGIPFETLTSADCRPKSMETNLEGSVIVIKSEILSPEYRTIDHQLALCTGGNGSRPEARGRAVFCTNLYDGKSSRFERQDVAGIILPERMPEWAHKKLEALQKPAEKESVADKIWQGNTMDFVPLKADAVDYQLPTTNEFKLYFPISITLYHGKINGDAIEPYFISNVNPQFIEAANKVIRDHPMSNASGNGILKDFYTDDEVYDFYVRSTISCAIPSIVEVDGELFGMITYTLNSDTELPYRIVDALKEDIERQFMESMEGWDVGINVPINGGALRYDNGHQYLDSQHSALPNGEVLQNAEIIVRVNLHDFDFVETLEELKDRIACNTAEKHKTLGKTSAVHDSNKKESVIEKIRQGTPTTGPEKPTNKKRDKDGPEH